MRATQLLDAVYKDDDCRKVLAIRALSAFERDAEIEAVLEDLGRSCSVMVREAAIKALSGQK